MDKEILHFIIIGIVVLVIVGIQIKIYLSSLEKMKLLKSVFSDNQKDYQLSTDYQKDIIKNANEDELNQLLESKGINVKKYYQTTYNPLILSNNGDVTVFNIDKARTDLIAKLDNTEVQIESKIDNSVFNNIKKSLNNYLAVNKSGASDFHLMKDIVDRNCDTLSEEIQTQIPIPLYLGLMGTMAGILIGVGFLAFSGGLNALLTTEIPQYFINRFPPGTNLESIQKTWSVLGSQGVMALMGGVALAMVASISGLILTTVGSFKVKNANVEFENNKHQFLSWIQSKLLPNLSNNTVLVLEKMSQNLVSFNSTFSANTGNLDSALAKVNESYLLQTQLLDTLNKIQDRNITKTNVELLNKLISTSGEIGRLGEYLQNTNDYLENVRDLNAKLDNYENRTQFLENASKFYAKHENWLTENIEEANRAMKDGVSGYNDAVKESLLQIKESLESQMRDFSTLIQEQQLQLSQKSKEVDAITKELQNLSSIKDSISKFEQATDRQNKKIDKLTESIKELAQAKSSGTSTPIIKLPKWSKIGAVAGFSIIVLSSLASAVSAFTFEKNKHTTEDIAISQPSIPQTVAMPMSSSTPAVKSLGEKKDSINNNK